VTDVVVKALAVAEVEAVAVAAIALLAALPAQALTRIVSAAMVVMAALAGDGASSQPGHRAATDERGQAAEHISLVA
jgi:hypothetical protein